LPSVVSKVAYRSVPARASSIMPMVLLPLL
jgi:hypothetical protein